MENPFVYLIVATTVTALITSLVGYIFWLKKREHIAKDNVVNELNNVQQELTKLKARADELETKLLSEQEVRKIAENENTELNKEMLELKTSILKLSELMSELRIDLGVLNYIKDRKPPRD